MTAYDGWKSHAESYAENGKKNQVKILIPSKLSSMVMWMGGGGDLKIWSYKCPNMKNESTGMQYKESVKQSMT